MTKRQSMKRYVRHQDVRDFFKFNILGIMLELICFGIGWYLSQCATCFASDVSIVCQIGSLIVILVGAIFGLGGLACFKTGWSALLNED